MGEQLTGSQKVQAGVTDAKLIADQAGSTTGKIELLAAAKAPVLEVIVSVGRQRTGLPLVPTKAFLRKAYNWAIHAATGEEPVERIDVVGTFDDDEIAKLNLLQFLMQEQVALGLGAKVRRAPYADRKAGVAKAFERRQGELERMFPQQ